MKKILIVCMANLCRSPMAQIVTMQFAAKAGLARRIRIDSAGTRASHQSASPDLRAKKVLTARGYAVGRMRSRRVEEDDFLQYDLVLAMDRSSQEDLRRLCPPAQKSKLRMFMEFAEPRAEDLDVPDPYYGDLRGFERVLDLCASGARGLITYCQTW